MRWIDVGLVILGAAIIVVPYAIIYRRIYGLHQTPYMVMSRGLGFTFHHPIWRAYTLFIEPREWFLQGVGMMQRCPWLVLGFAGVLIAWRDRALALLAFCLVDLLRHVSRLYRPAAERALALQQRALLQMGDAGLRPARGRPAA